MSIIVRYTAIALSIMLGTTCAYAGNHEEPDCPPMSGGSALKLQVDEYHLSLNNKKPICVEIDPLTGQGTVNIVIHNPPSADHDVQPGDVTAGQKANSPYEITGNNAGDGDDDHDDGDGEHLTLIVKEFESDAGTENDCGDGTNDVCAKFWINVVGVGELDPKVRVVEGGVEMRLHQDILGQVVKDLGLTPGDAIELLKAEQYGEE